MVKLKVCFVGIGSIAKRHIRNLHTVCIERDIEVQIDAFRRNDISVQGVSNIYTTIDSVPEDYDVIFITNPTEMHLESLKQFHNKGNSFFVEKPVVASGQMLSAKALQIRDDAVYYVAATLRYNAVIRWVKNNVDPADVISVRSISSSYLPNWRCGQDYRQTYSAHKDMGGGVSIDLIHEWDYLTYLFGWPLKVHSIIGKKSDLEIDSDDIAIYVAEYPSMTAEVHLDYFGRKTIREIEVFTKKDTIVGDISNNKLKFLVSGEELAFNEERDDFQKRELRYFLDMIDNEDYAEEEYHHSIEVLELAQGGYGFEAYC